MRLLKKTVLAVATLVLALAAFVAPTNNTKVEAANIPAGTVLYLRPNSNWKTDNARFAAYFFGTGNTWVSMTLVEGETDIYQVNTPAGSWTNVIFCRMNPSTTANNWNNGVKWNQTSDLVYDGTNNFYTVKENTWDKGGGTWAVYEPGIVAPEPEPEPEPEIGELKLGLVGTFNNWGVSSPDTAMTYVAEKERYEAEITFTAGDIFKIRLDNTWSKDWGWSNENNDPSLAKYCSDANDMGNIKVNASGTYIVWIDSTTTHIGIEPVGEIVEPEQPEEPEVGGLVLGVIGTFNGWGEDVDMTYNAEKNRYEVEMTFAANVEWKIRLNDDWVFSWGWHDENNDKSMNTYCTNPENGNIKVKTAGKYLVWIVYESNDLTHIGMEPVVEPWELEVKVAYQIGTKDESKALRLVAEFNLTAEMLEDFNSTIAFRVTHNGKADERNVTTLYSSVNPMNDEAELTGAYYAVLTYVNIPAGEYNVEVLVDGEVAATVVATVA